jgi:hypothetical protein
VKAFKIQIILGNEAMRSPDDVANALHDLALKLEDLGWQVWQPQAIKDRDGNTVGQWEVR